MLELSSICGGLLIFFGCSVIGFSAARMYRLRVEQLEAFLKLISHIKAQIDYCRLPLDRILDGYESSVLTGCGFLLTSRELGVHAGFESCRGRLLLTVDESNELGSFFDGLGKHGAVEESAHCAYYEGIVGKALSHEREELVKRGKLCRAFGMLSGFLIAILLI